MLRKKNEQQKSIHIHILLLNNKHSIFKEIYVVERHTDKNREYFEKDHTELFILILREKKRNITNYQF